MANFEALIKQALQNQNDADPAVRRRVYQSSRNALSKMLAKSPGAAEEAKQQQVRRLEASIARIEDAYAPAAAASKPEPVVEPVPQAIAEPAPASEPQSDEPADRLPIPPAPPVPPSAPLSAPSQPETPASQAERANSVLAMLEQASLGTARPRTPAPMQPPAAPPASPMVLEDGQRPPSNGNGSGNGDGLGLDDYDPAPLFPAPPPFSSDAAEEDRPGESDPFAQGMPPSSDGAQSMPPFAPRPGRRDAPPDLDPAGNADFFASRDMADAPGSTDAAADGSGSDAGMGEVREAYSVYRRKNPILRRLWPIALVLGILLVVLWILYAIFTNLSGDNPAASTRESPGPVGQTQVGDDGNATITLLEPTDLSALVTAGRGTAELKTGQNEQILRLQSVRSGAGNAEPILLELERGVLQQVMGKTVTVEFLAKSGMSGPAQFAVECEIGGEGVCGRKRFRVGQQPELILFSMDLSKVSDAGLRAFLALNTDITALADSSGKGDVIDVLYARLRFTP
ncbi:MAG: hypothetical protein KDJ80_04375 [Nitratireductor sp.]|nr:hypothetical protein [Nitratireductor sp.]